MEIHPPHGPIHSVKQFLLQLLTITIGILIALSLDGALEWRHYRHLTQEARTNLSAEIRDNRAELDEILRGLAGSERQLQNILQAIHRLQDNRTAPVGEIPLTWTIGELHTTAWNTAIGTGAISHMSYGEVQSYTRLYDLQREFELAQEKAMDARLELYGIESILNRDSKKVSTSQLESAERIAGTCMAGARSLADIGKALDQEYAAHLGEK